MKKRIIALNGGLGNQMFQYSFGRMLEITKGCRIEFDTSFYKNNLDRTVEIQKYNIEPYEFKAHPVYNRIRRVFQRIPVVCWLLGIYKEYDEFQIDQRVNKYNYRFYYGYWQNKDYYSTIKKTIKKELIFSGSLNDSEMDLVRRIEDTDTVAIHVRRGDYLEGKCKSIYTDLNEEYYRKAILRANTLLGDSSAEGAKLFFFSNDIIWCKEHFADLTNAVFIDDSMSSSEHTDMMMMQKSRCLIMANSTFSWWAAWLSDREDRIIITPSRWFKDDVINDRAVRALVDSAWITENI